MKPFRRKSRYRLVALAALAGVAACLALAVLLNHLDAQFGANLGIAGSVVSGVVAVVAAALPYLVSPTPATETRPEIPYGPPDSNRVVGEVTRVLVAVDDICSGRRPVLDEAEGSYVRNAVNQAKEALGTTAERKFSERAESLGLDPSILISSLQDHESAVSAWASADRDFVRVLRLFRQWLLESLGSDQAPWRSDNTRQFFRDAGKEGKRKFSRDWAGILPVLNTWLEKPAEPGPGTEAAQARRRCRIPEDKYFTGRSQEIADVLALVTRQMSSKGTAVVHMTGQQPGVGTSAVARAVAQKLERTPLFPGGVLYFDLHGLDNANVHGAGNFDLRGLDNAQRMTAEDVAKEVLAALGAKLGTRLIADYEAAMQEKGVLLVLDNAADSSHVEQLARRIPRCCVLVTSRKQSQSYADSSLKVDPLPREDSLALLLKYAGKRPGSGWPADVRPSCELLAAYCDDVPMALHLVGAQIESRPAEMSLSDRLGRLLERLKEAADEAHRLNRLEGSEQKISNAILLSYALLDGDGKRLLRMCHAIRAYDVTSSEVAFCLGREEERGRVEDGLENFVDISLARQTLARSGRHPLVVYSLFNLIRWFAAVQRLREDSAESVTEFARSYVIYMRKCLDELSEGATDADRDVDPRLTRDAEPFIIALLLALDNGWADLGIPLGTALNSYLISGGQSDQAAAVIDLLVRFHLRHDRPDAAVSTLLEAAGRLREAGLLTAAMRAGQQALDLARRYERDTFIPFAASAVSLAAAELKDWGLALEAGTTAATMLLNQGNEDAAFRAMINLCTIAQQADAPDTALEWALKAVELSQDSPRGSRRKRARAYFELGRARVLRKEYPDALGAYQKATDLFEDAGDFRNAAVSAANGGYAARNAVGSAEAIPWHERSIELWERAIPVDKLDKWLRAAQRVQLSAALAACDAVARAAEILTAAVEDLAASRAAPALLLEARVRLAALSLFLDGRKRAPSLDIDDEAASKAHVAEEVAALRAYRHGGTAGALARKKLQELSISPVRNSAPIERWYYQQLSDEPS